MSAPLLAGGAARLFSKFVKLPGRALLLGDDCVRYASKKAGGSSRNKRKNTPGKSRGFKKKEIDHAHTGEVLLTQLGLKVYPGENVGIKGDCSLYALTSGTVMKSWEQLTPYPTSPLYPAVQKGRVFTKNFVHVISEVKQGRFKLISQV